MNPISRRAVLTSSAGFVAGSALITRRANATLQEHEHAGLPPGQPGIDYTPVVTPNGASLPWKVVDGVIDYDAGSEAPGDKNLWTEREFGDFILHVDWRITATGRAVLVNAPNEEWRRLE